MITESMCKGMDFSNGHYIENAATGMAAAL